MKVRDNDKNINRDRIAKADGVKKAKTRHRRRTPQKKVKGRPSIFGTDWPLIVVVVVLVVISFITGSVYGAHRERVATKSQKRVVTIQGDTLFGININSTDNSTDFEEVIKRSMHLSDFVFIRATDGYQADAIFERAYACAKEHKRLTGVYFQYSSSFNLDAKIFAAHCVRLFGQHRVGKAPAVLYLDETKGEELSPGWVRTWLTTFHALTGVKPLVRMSSEMAREYDWAPVFSGGYELWMAYYGPDDGQNYGMPEEGIGEWSRLRMQQFTTKALEGAVVGANVFFGTEDEWKTLARTSPI